MTSRPPGRWIWFSWRSMAPWVADGYDDCEGDLIGRVRALLPNATIGVEIDPHCHLTHRMIEDADVIIIFKEYPHIDIAERGRGTGSMSVGARRSET